MKLRVISEETGEIWETSGDEWNIKSVCSLIYFNNYKTGRVPFAKGNKIIKTEVDETLDMIEFRIKEIN